MIDEEEKETKKEKMTFLEYHLANTCATYFIYQNYVDF